MKIAVVGYSGGGKSYLSDRLATLYGIPVMHLDAVKYDKNWVAKDKTLVLNQVALFMEKESWIIDGNYSALYQKERLLAADEIIIVKPGSLRCLWGVIKREKEYKRMGYVKSLNFDFICFVLFGGRTKKRRQHYKDIENQYKDKTTVIRTKRQLNEYIKRREQRDQLCQKNGNT